MDRVNAPARTVALLESPLFRQHFAAEAHPECPERLDAVEAGLAHALAKQQGWFTSRLDARAATREQLARVHDTEYLDQLQSIRGRSGYLDSDTFISPGSLDAAELAAGGAIALVDALLTRRATFGLGLVRPPGHHATRDRAMGFCLLNNVAIAAAHALASGAKRVFIFDWDVHHGNGTQDIFYERNDVLFCSIHQYPWYPGTGATRETGRGPGRGFNVNIPLSRNAGDSAYVAAFERLVHPLLEHYDPDLVLVSAGYDAHGRDPLAQMRVSSAGFGEIARRLAALLASHSTPMGLLLEGGYDLLALRESLEATFDGIIKGYDDPDRAVFFPEGPMSSLHEREIESALEQQRSFWAL
jgi:acetoin utilization deacetylase AcuC-like enzyme